MTIGAGCGRLAVVRVRDTCPSCRAAVSPDDLLCANCELILDVNRLPDRPNESADFSVVRRMLEVPQRGLPSDRPSGPLAPVGLGDDSGTDGPTRVFSLARNMGVPMVVASLTKKALSLSELEAFVVSLIDGERDVKALAQKARIGELEMSVVLQALNDKHVVDFADEAPPDVAPARESARITADEEPEAATVVIQPVRAAPDEPRTAPTERLAPVRVGPGAKLPDPAPTPPPEKPLPPPRRAAPRPGAGARPPAPTPPAAPTPPPRGRSRPPPPTPDRAPTATPPLPPPRVAPAQAVLEADALPSVIVEPVESVVLEADVAPAPLVTPPEAFGEVLPPPPSTPPEAPDLVLAPAPAPTRARRTLPPGSRSTGSRPAPPLKLDARGPVPAPPPTASPSGVLAPEAAAAEGEERRESTDPRIINRGRVNQKVLDALKQVKRRDAPAGEAAARVDEPGQESIADRLAAGSLQVAIRMEQNGRLDEAVRFLENSISKSPDAPSLYNRLAIIMMRERGDLLRAEQLLQKAVELAPGHEVYEKNLTAVVSKRAMGKR